jgi:hypothetical protein
MFDNLQFDNSRWSGLKQSSLKQLSKQLIHATFDPLRQSFANIPVRNPELAHRLCRLIPAQCPFERDVQFLSWQFHIPALCKLNPFYEELVELRFRALIFLADECGEDVTVYCQAASVSKL